MFDSTNNYEKSIPNKRYFSIGEVSDLCDVKDHVLRYWEQEFKCLSPSKRRGNRRYYTQKDIQTIRHIKYLLQEEGYTIGGAKNKLAATSPKTDRMDISDPYVRIAELETVIKELQAVIRTLSNE